MNSTGVLVLHQVLCFWWFFASGINPLQASRQDLHPLSLLIACPAIRQWHLDSDKWWLEEIGIFRSFRIEEVNTRKIYNWLNQTKSNCKFTLTQTFGQKARLSDDAKTNAALFPIRCQLATDLWILGSSCKGDHHLSGLIEYLISVD